jgi:hypothetical protein
MGVHPVCHAKHCGRAVCRGADREAAGRVEKVHGRVEEDSLNKILSLEYYTRVQGRDENAGIKAMRR